MWAERKGKSAHRLHDVFERIETDIAGSSLDLSIHGHGETLAGGREDERPFPPNQRQLHREQAEYGTEDTRKIDVDILPIRVCNRLLTG